MNINISFCNPEVQETILKVVSTDLANRCKGKYSKCPLPDYAECPIDVLDCPAVEVEDWKEYFEKQMEQC